MKPFVAHAFRGVLVAAALAMGLWIPGAAYACSCAPPGAAEIDSFADEPSVVVFVGTITSVAEGTDAQGRTVGTLAVQHVFKGELPAQVRIFGGGGNLCLLNLEVGRQMIAAANLEEGGVTPNTCLPTAHPSTEEGQRLVDEATAAYGPGRAPPRPPDDPADPEPGRTTMGDLGLAIVLTASLAVVVVLFGAIAVFARRRSA